MNRSSTTGGLGPILVATDFSANSSAALDLARVVACQLGVEIVLLHVDSAPETAPLAAEALARRERVRAELDRSRQALEEASVPVRVLLRPGDPAREILRVAEAHTPAVIVMGTHGDARANAPLLGSVADRVVRYAPYPVLVVPNPARQCAPILSGLAAD